MTEASGLSPHTKFESRLEAAARERREEVARIEADLAAAAERGELWTVQAALYPGKAFVLVYHGHNEDMEPLESQHRDSGAFFGPLRVKGTQREAMKKAFDLFSVSEITIRVVV
jgi:hypothetical protein